MKVPKPAPQNNGKLHQFITAIIINLVTISFGIGCGWPSPIMPQFHSDNPPFGDKPLTNDQISWITSIPAIGGLFTIPFCGSLSERIGRKKFAILTGIPQIISWILIIIGQNLITLYIARIISGMGAAMAILIIPLYISEIATEDIRGILGSLLLFTLNIGILLAYIAGSFLSYRLFASFALIFPSVYIVMIFFIPETPAYLVRRNRQLEAHKSLMFYRGNNEVLVEQELIQLKAQSTVSDHSSTKTVSFGEFFRDRATRKGLIISIGVIAAQQLSGIVAMTNYAETIFKLSGSSVSSEISSITIAVIQIIGSQTSTLLMERAGRRLLSLISSIGMAISLSVVGTFFYLQRHNYDISSISWLPIFALSSFIVTYCLGIGPIPFVVVSEVFKLDISSFATTICFILFFIFGFVGIRAFDLMMHWRGPDACFFMLAGISVMSFLFCYFLLPETKGRKREDIIDELAGKKKVHLQEPKLDDDTSSKLLTTNTMNTESA